MRRLDEARRPSGPRGGRPRTSARPRERRVAIHRLMVMADVAVRSARVVLQLRDRPFFHRLDAPDAPPLGGVSVVEPELRSGYQSVVRISGRGARSRAARYPAAAAGPHRGLNLGGQRRRNALVRVEDGISRAPLPAAKFFWADPGQSARSRARRALRRSAVSSLLWLSTTSTSSAQDTDARQASMLAASLSVMTVTDSFATAATIAPAPRPIGSSAPDRVR